MPKKDITEKKIASTKEIDGVIVCKTKLKLTQEHVDGIRESMTKAFKGKEIIILDKDFDIMKVPFVKIDVDKMATEIYNKMTEQKAPITRYLTEVLKGFLHEFNNQISSGGK